MRKVFVKQLEYKSAFTLPEISDEEVGPFLFHKWGMYKGDSRAILEDEKTGKIIMIDPCYVRFEPEQK